MNFIRILLFKGTKKGAIKAPFFYIFNQKNYFLMNFWMRVTPLSSFTLKK